ncbi:hypothetical protein Tco_1335609 [Tanacetum coccineum]
MSLLHLLSIDNSSASATHRRIVIFLACTVFGMQGLWSCPNISAPAGRPFRCVTYYDRLAGMLCLRLLAYIHCHMALLSTVEILAQLLSLSCKSTTYLTLPMFFFPRIENAAAKDEDLKCLDWHARPKSLGGGTVYVLENVGELMAVAVFSYYLWILRKWRCTGYEVVVSKDKKWKYTDGLLWVPHVGTPESRIMKGNVNGLAIRGDGGSTIGAKTMQKASADFLVH